MAIVFSTACRHFQNENAPTESASGKNAIQESTVPGHLKKTTVILIGETHYYTPVESYEYLLKNSLPGAKFCLAVEFPKSSGGFDKSLAELSSRIKKFKSNQDDSEDVRRMERVLRTYEKLFQLAESLHIKMHGIDDESHYVSNLDVEQRNHEMAKNISDLVESGQCNRILAILGKAHLTLGLYRKASVKGLLLAKKIDSLTVNLQMTNEDAVPYAYQSFNLSGIVAPDANFEWLENITLQKMVRVLPHIENDLSVWQEFDWTLLLPQTLSAQPF